MHAKFVLPIFLSLIILFCCLSSSRPKDDYDLSMIFTQDSGYIDKKGLLYIFPGIDTIGFEISDSIFGKYFRDNLSGNYIAIVYHPNEGEYTSTQLISVNLAANKINEGRGFSSWFYDAGSQIDNFRKIGGYYYLPTCIGHGSAFQADGFYFFKDVKSVGSPIYESIYSGGVNAEYKTLVINDMIIVQDTLKIEYAVDTGIFEEVVDDYIDKVLSTKEYKIDYYRTTDDWVANDSTLFKTEEMLFM